MANANEILQWVGLARDLMNIIETDIRILQGDGTSSDIQQAAKRKSALKARWEALAAERQE